jgi:hypothetical protein
MRLLVSLVRLNYGNSTMRTLSSTGKINVSHFVGRRRPELRQATSPWPDWEEDGMGVCRSLQHEG